MYESHEMDVVLFEKEAVFTFDWHNSGETSGTNSLGGDSPSDM